MGPLINTITAAIIATIDGHLLTLGLPPRTEDSLEVDTPTSVNLPPAPVVPRVTSVAPPPEPAVPSVASVSPAEERDYYPAPCARCTERYECCLSSRARCPERPRAHSAEYHQYCTAIHAFRRLPFLGLYDCFTFPSCPQLPTSSGSCAWHSSPVKV